MYHGHTLYIFIDRNTKLLHGSPQYFCMFYLETEVGLHGSFWILAAILFITLPFMFIYIPEPKVGLRINSEVIDKSNLQS